MSQISHPRIVEFMGFIIESFSIVMEFMEEGTLADFLKQNRDTSLSWAVKYWFAADIAEGMAYLHSKNTTTNNHKIEVFHQDLKPANVLLTRENGVLRGKISDLGLAAIKTGGESPKKHQQSMLTSFVAHQGGTYAYMSPELIKGSTKVSGKSSCVPVHILLNLIHQLICFIATISKSSPRRAMYTHMV